MLAPLEGWRPQPRGNPGSATVNITERNGIRLMIYGSWEVGVIETPNKQNFKKLFKVRSQLTWVFLTY